MSQEIYLSVDAIGNNICERYIGEDGLEHRRKVKYEPTLFVQSSKPTEYKDIYGRFCMPKRFDTMGQAKKWTKENEGMFEVLGMDDFEFTYISDTYKTRELNMDAIRVANIDIEVPAPEFPDPNMTRYEIKTIVHYDSIDDIYHFFGVASESGEWNKSSSILEAELLDKVRYYSFANEKELLTAYLMYWKEFTPVIITGWNVEQFDMPYIIGRMEKTIGETAVSYMSPWNKVSTSSVSDNYGKATTKVNIVGVHIIDYLELYRKFTFTPRPNFRLDYIGQVEVGQQKLDFEQETYLKFYQEDYQRFGDYNIRDVELVNKIDGKLMLLQLAVTLGYYAGINFTTVFGTIKPWDAIIFNALRKDKKVVSARKRREKKQFIGAFVKAPIPGFYKNILSFDLTSLYPSIIRQCNISPECIRGQFDGHMTIEQQIEALVLQTLTIPAGDYSASANGMLYTKEFQGVIPEVITKVFFERKAHKKKMLEYQRQAVAAKESGNMDEYKRLSRLETQENIQQMVRKIQINSLYGALGNAFFRYYDERNAEAVTSFGQLAIKWVARDINAYLNKACGTIDADYVVYGDTDSVYISFDQLLKVLGKDTLPEQERVDVLDKIGKAIEDKVINPSYDKLTEFMNNYEKQMFMDREAIALTGFFIAKKRYALNVYDMEGTRYHEPKLKIMGIETQRSSTPQLAQRGLKECIRRILQESESSLQEYVTQMRTDWFNADYHDISYVSSANNLGKYSDSKGMPAKGCPGHIKGVLAYNRAAKEYGFDAIQEGEKVALVKLREPNKYGTPVMAYPSGSDLPNNIDPEYLKGMIDYSLLYDEKFISPLSAICQAISWDYEQNFSLSSFFG